MDQAEELISERTKIVALAHQSNVLGTINPVADIAARAHAVGALVLVDAAQSVPHGLMDVGSLGADFVGFTGHKMCGPTGIGVLWARRDLLDEIPPFLGGGEMIETVWMDRSTYAPPPHKFEAGTMPIAQAVGLAAAVDYLSEVDLALVRGHEQNLVRRALQSLSEIDGLRILGPTAPVDRGSAISFTLQGVHPHDVSQVLDDRGVAVRAGHHCAWPLHRAFGVQSSTRASFYLYNTPEEVDALADGIRTAQKFVNPICGDEVTLRVTLKDAGGEPAVADVSYDALGCSISQASVSVLTDLVIGKPVSEALKINSEFLELMRSRDAAEPDEDVLGDAVVFAGVAKYPARIKCALLGWMAWKDATAQAIETQSGSDDDTGT